MRAWPTVNNDVCRVSPIKQSPFVCRFALLSVYLSLELGSLSLLALETSETGTYRALDRASAHTHAHAHTHTHTHIFRHRFARWLLARPPVGSVGLARVAGRHSQPLRRRRAWPAVRVWAWRAPLAHFAGENKEAARVSLKTHVLLLAGARRPGARQVNRKSAAASAISSPDTCLVRCGGSARRWPLIGPLGRQQRKANMRMQAGCKVDDETTIN